MRMNVGHEVPTRPKPGVGSMFVSVDPLTHYKIITVIWIWMKNIPRSSSLPRGFPPSSYIPLTHSKRTVMDRDGRCPIRFQLIRIPNSSGVPLTHSKRNA
ncbi:hypothetical protein J6590_052301 [Homalodisca vitripennis]|nr:hypothetical protein J6590_052301 [Homalodisca vitripennis]